MIRPVVHLQRLFIPVAFLLSLSTHAWGDVWNGTPEGATGVFIGIADSTQASTIDDHIRGDRQNVRYRAEVEHIWGHQDGLADDNGLHRLGSARCYFQATAPTTLNDSHSTAAITDYLNTGVSDGGEAGLEDSSSSSAGGAEDDIGHGRCWIDSDDMRLYIFEGEAGDDTPAAVADGWKLVQNILPLVPDGIDRESLKHFTGNLVFHGSFDGTDGDGDPAATGTTTGMPYGWTNRFTDSTGTHTYVDPVTTSEGEGLMYVHTNAAGGTDSGIQQVIGGLKASTWYKFAVRVSANSGDTCQLRVTGTGVTTIPGTQEDETSTTGSFETLLVWAQTNASAADLTMILQGPDNDDACSWKHASVTERTEVAAPPGIIVYKNSNTSTTACATAYTSGCTNIVSIIVNPPSAGYHIMLKGKAVLNGNDDDKCSLELWDDTAGVQLDEVYFNMDASSNDILYLNVDYISNTPLVPGTPITYTLNAKENTGGSDNCVLNGDNSIEALLLHSGR